MDPSCDRKKVLVLGSGPIRIGQGIEFDYCSVHCVWALKKAGCETVIVNNNPETVSTDFDVADKLYFEPLTPEYVTNIVELEKPDGAIVQFGGQTAIKLTETAQQSGRENPRHGQPTMAWTWRRTASVLTKSWSSAPSRARRGKRYSRRKRLLAAAHMLGYPVLVRPSYVLGGQGMQIAASDEDIANSWRSSTARFRITRCWLINTSWGRRWKWMRSATGAISLSPALWSTSTARASIPATRSPFIPPSA